MESVLLWVHVCVTTDRIISKEANIDFEFREN